MTTPSKIWMRSLSPSLILVCTLTVSPTRNSGTWPRTSGFTFRCSTSSIAFARIFVPSSLDYRSPKNQSSSSLLLPEEIRAPLARARERLLLAPARDPRVIAGQEYIGYLQPAELRRAGVLRPLEQALAGEALALCGELVPQHTREQPRHRVHNRQRSDLPAREHEIAQRQFLVHPAEDALVHALIAAAHQDQGVVAGELDRLGLVEAGPLRGHQHHPGGGRARPGRLDGRHQGLRLHHHARAAAVGNVVGDAVLAPPQTRGCRSPARARVPSRAPCRGCSPPAAPRPCAGTG